MGKLDVVSYLRRDVLRYAAVGATLLAAKPLRCLAAAAPLRIGTIGAGRIGGTLGRLWARSGHPVMLSSRHPERLEDLVAVAGPNARAGTVAQTVAFADVILLAVPYSAVPQIARDFARQLSAKRLILDASNPVVSRDGEVAKAALEKGVGLYAAELLPRAPIVRAFNAISFATIAESGYRTGSAVGVPMAGDSPKGLAVAQDLVRKIGFEPVVLGSLETSGKWMIPGNRLSGEHTAEEIHQIAWMGPSVAYSNASQLQA